MALRRQATREGARSPHLDVEHRARPELVDDRLVVVEVGPILAPKVVVDPRQPRVGEDRIRHGRRPYRLASRPMPTLGPLVPADETFHHQITDTFATVSQSDRSWTEKVCAMAAHKDGRAARLRDGQVPEPGRARRLRRHQHRRQQWTVRSSRRLAPEVERMETGPIRYEVLEPLAVCGSASPPTTCCRSASSGPSRARAVRPRAARAPPQPGRLRLDADIVRYHQIGTATGWAEVDGTRFELDDATSVSTRDHSWGVRYMVGAPVEDVEEAPRPSSVSTTVIWSPILCERPDGSRYGIHTYYQRHGIGGWQRIELQGGIEHPDGRREPWAALVPQADVDDATRRLAAAQLDFTMADGSARPITVTALGDTGFHLGTGLYFGFDGHWHGEWRGDLHVDGEHLADCTDVDTAHRIHQMRDNLVRVDDPVGGGTGYGNLQSIFAGPHPDIGLTEEASFL